MTIGHPDFLGAVSPSPPLFLTGIGDFAAGGTWGPVNVKMPQGGSYEFNLFAITETSFMVTDVTINHLDSRGFPSYQDFYAGVIAGVGLPGGAGGAQSAILRGNLYGNTLQISGQLASSAFLNAVIPGHAFTASGMRGNVYSTPFALADPQPKVTAAAPSVGVTAPNLTPASLLATMPGTGVTHATTTAAVPLLNYHGPALLDIVQSFIASPGNAVFTINGWTVSNGSGAPVTIRRFPNLANNVPSQFQLNLAPMLHTFTFQNADPANDAIVWASIHAGKAA